MFHLSMYFVCEIYTVINVKVRYFLIFFFCKLSGSLSFGPKRNKVSLQTCLVSFYTQLMRRVGQPLHGILNYVAFKENSINMAVFRDRQILITILSYFKSEFH